MNMLSFDLQTLFAISFLIELILTLMTLLYWQTQQIYKGFAAWTGAFLLKALYLGLFFYRAALPDWADIGMGNILVISVLFLRYEALCRFFERRPDWFVGRRSWLLFILAIGAVLAVGAKGGQDGTRGLLVTVLTCFYSGLFIWRTFSVEKTGVGVIAVILGLFQLVSLLSLLLRFAQWFGDAQLRSLLPITQCNQLFFSLDILLEVGIGIAFLIMNSRRLMEELITAQASLEALSQIDPLTGGYNRRGLIELAKREVSRAKRFRQDLTLIIFDIDFFKAVNDTFGHAAGDAALVHVVKEAKRCIRDADIIGRFGGDEFVIVFPGIPVGHARKVVARLRHELMHSPLVWEEKPLEIRLSVGAAGLKKEDANFEALLGRADQHLYEAKRLGRDKIVADQEEEE